MNKDSVVPVAGTDQEATTGPAGQHDDDESYILPQIVLAEERYRVIGEILEEVYRPGKERWLVSDMLDRVLLHKYLGVPVFLVTMWAMFTFTFEASRVFSALIELFFEWLGTQASLVPVPWLQSLIQQGLIGGVGFILVFVPPIMFMYLSIAVLEDSGYLARAAFVVDRAMMRIGLHGRSFIPLLLGFGCSVPAIMAARTVDAPSNRLTTILVAPLMSCSARLPVYILLAGVFFPAFAGTVVFAMYLLGIVMAVVMALVFKNTLFRGESSPLLMELPTYQRPTVHGVFRHTWDRTLLFLKKAGSYLLVGALVLWCLSYVGPGGLDVPLSESYIALLGHFLAPVFAPLGFSWQIVSALVFGLFAKEVVVESLSIIFSVEGGAAIGAALTGVLTPVSALALMVFVLLYTPCIATIGTTHKETGSWAWTAFSVVYQLVLAYLMALAVVVIGGLLVA